MFRALDRNGRLITFMLSGRRNTNAAYRFLRKAMLAVSHYPSSSITTDKLASHTKAIGRLKNEGLLRRDERHRISKYPNNIIVADNGALKRMIRRDHCILRERRATGEIRLVNQLFDLFA